MMNYLTIEQAAPKLHVHIKTLREWCLRGRIPARKFGRRWLINPKVIDRIMSEDYIEPKQEGQKWRSSNVAKRGISASNQTDKAYINLLKRQ